MSENTEIRLMEMVSQSLRDLQDIKTGLAVMTSDFARHTEADARNFNTMEAHISALSAEMRSIQIEQAEERGAEAQSAKGDATIIKVSRASLVKWGAGIATVIAAVAEGIRQLAAK